MKFKDFKTMTRPYCLHQGITTAQSGTDTLLSHIIQNEIVQNCIESNENVSRSH